MNTTTVDAITVWIVEDDNHFRETLSFVLDHSTGIRCGRTFTTGEEVTAYLDERGKWQVPDVFLVDINLPGVSGLDLIRSVKTALPTTQLVMITSRDDADTIFTALSRGASGYLAKSATIDQIVTAVREAAAGGTLLPADVAAKVLGFFNQSVPAPEYGLSDREVDVLREMTAGFTQKEIADRLFVTVNTVNTHVQHIYDKLHVRNGIEAVAKALREKIV